MDEVKTVPTLNGRSPHPLHPCRKETGGRSRGLNGATISVRKTAGRSPKGEIR